MTEYLPSPVPSDAYRWPDELPFTAFDQWGEESLDLRVFEQTIWWVDRHCQPHKLAQMSVEYRVAVIAHLVDNIVRFHAASALKQAIELDVETRLGLPGYAIIAAIAGDPPVTDLTPESWLESTPLMRALRRSLRA